MMDAGGAGRWLDSGGCAAMVPGESPGRVGWPLETRPCPCCPANAPHPRRNTVTIAAEQRKCSFCGWYGCVPSSRRPDCWKSRTTTHDYRLVTFGPEVRQDLGALLNIIRDDQRPLVRCYAESVALLCRMWDNANQREWFA